PAMSTIVRRARPASILALLLVAAPAAAQQLKTLTLEDYPHWSRITDVALSDDGRWMSYAYTPNDGDATLHVRNLEGETVHTAKNGSGAAFSADGRFVAFLTNLPREEQEKLRRDRKPVPRGLDVIDLQTGVRSHIADVQSFAFSADG